MLTPEYSGQFKRDVKLAQKRRKDMEKLKAVMVLLLEESPLPERYRQHALTGRWKGVMDVHIEPDWLLLYTPGTGSLRFERTGSHADLFSR